MYPHFLMMTNTGKGIVNVHGECLLVSDVWYPLHILRAFIGFKVLFWKILKLHIYIPVTKREARSFTSKGKSYADDTGTNLAD